MPREIRLLRPGQRGRVRRRRPCWPLAAGRGQPAPAVGRGALRALTGAGADRPGQLGPAAGGVVAGALWAWARDRPVLTGVLIGLGTATKLYPLFLLGGAAGHLPARPAAARDFGRSPSPAACAAWVVANLPAYLTGPRAVAGLLAVQLRPRRRPRLGLAGARAGARTRRSPRTRSTSGRGCSSAVWCVGVLAARAARARDAAPGAARLPVVAGFLLVNKVYSPQYVLWLLPLAVLARPRWRDQLGLAGRRDPLLRAVWWYLGGYLDAGRRRATPASTGWRSCCGCWPSSTSSRIVARDILWPRARPGARPLDAREPARAVSVDPVERRRGVADPDVDLVADLGHPRPAGRNSIEACMCGGSAKSRCLPSMENGDRTKPTASRPPRARVAARALSDGSPVGASRPMPWAVPPLTTSRWPGLGAGAAAVAERVAALDRVHVEHGGGDPAARRGRRATGRCRRAAGS